jgi:hypothetical protein
VPHKRKIQKHRVLQQGFTTRIKFREGLVKKDKREVFQSGNWVKIILRKKSNIKHAAENHFIDGKWGPAKIVGILPMNKIDVWCLDKR